jgi:hypothetical protein
MSPVIKTSVSIEPSVHNALKLREAQLSTSIDTATKRYLYALWEARRRLASQFGPGECGLMIDTLNGSLFYPYSINMLPAGIADAIELDRLDQKWEVDGAALVAKLEALDYFQRLAIIDALECWWNRSHEDPQPAFADLLTGHPDNAHIQEFQA